MIHAAAVLQQKARVSAPEVCQIFGRPDEIEAKILIELFGFTEIPRGNICLDLDVLRAPMVVITGGADRYSGALAAFTRMMITEFGTIYNA